ncbi:MAG TPA: hypothetical protein VNN55_12595 [bacterium]|nr:hypothetical protein [bacterium]
MTGIYRRLTFTLAVAALVGLLLPLDLLAQGMYNAKPAKLPWKIAFQRDKNIWLMNGDGSNQRLWRPFGNVAGKMSFSPDGRTLIWARQGEFTYNLPDGGGGGRRLFDLFLAEVDSTREGYWRWVTFNHGSRGAEFSPDGQRIVYCYDLNANIVDAELPDYQIVHSRIDGSDLKKLARPDARPGECQGMDPTWSPDGKQVAFTYFLRRRANIGEGSKDAPTRPLGLVVVPATGITAGEDELEAMARQNGDAVMPAWSPDGRAIAFVSSNSADGSIYLINPDLTNRRKLVEKTDRLVPAQAPVSWSPDSKWIVFSTVDGFIYVAPTDGSGKPERITSGGNDYMPVFSRK